MLHCYKLGEEVNPLRRDVMGRLGRVKEGIAEIIPWP